jgi:hypothetical protein
VAAAQECSVRAAAILPLLAALILPLAACGRSEDPPQRLRMIQGQERPAPVAWNGASGGFELAGKPLRTVKLWTFDGSTEGFTAPKSEVLPAEGPGLHVRLRGPILRSPRGLAVDGSVYSLVLVRLTRLKAGGGWDGALYYATPLHGESAQFVGKPLQGADPAVGETTVLIYDMRHLAAGGGDWKTAEIDQIRLDLEDRPGGEFLIHQVAIAERADLSGAPPPAS